MSLGYKPQSPFAPDFGQNPDAATPFDFSTFVDSTGNGRPRPASIDSGQIPSGLFAYGDAGSGAAGSISLSTATLAAPAPTTVTSSTSPLVIKLIWDTSVASAPSAFMTAVIAAAQSYEASFNNAVTINLDIGYGEIGGSMMGNGALGESESYLQSVSYASLLAALKTHNGDATTAAVIASLPATAPVGGYLWVTTAQAKALGLASAGGSGLDGYIGLSSSYGFTYNATIAVASGTYDFNGVVSHEISEVMGRMMLTGSAIGNYVNSYSLLDLLHYAAPGVRDFSAAVPGYFSTNGGASNGGAFNTVSGGDAADWASSMGNNAFDAFSNAGVVNAITTGDITEMNAIGWSLAAAPVTPPVTTPPPPPTTPNVAPPGTNVITAIETSLAGAQGPSGLTANSPLAMLTSAGGVAGDPVTFTLGGSGVGSFLLANHGNKTATLSAGAAGVAGGTNGRVYALTLNATDTVTRLSSGPSAFDVVVAGSAGDTVSIATLVGAASKATPTFIYGLAGNDTLNGSGMTGNLWFDGGAGADVMTGGNAPNTYLYNANSDSTASVMDVITNFAVNKDTIDLTGIGSTHLTFVGSLLGNKLAADSIGYQISGFNTFVYVNTSGGSEALSATNMKIDLNGWQPIGTNNVLHN